MSEELQRPNEDRDAFLPPRGGFGMTVGSTPDGMKVDPNAQPAIVPGIARPLTAKPE